MNEVPISETVQSIVTMLTNAYASSFMTGLQAPNYCGLLLNPRCEIIIALVLALKITSVTGLDLHGMDGCWVTGSH